MFQQIFVNGSSSALIVGVVDLPSYNMAITYQKMYSQSYINIIMGLDGTSKPLLNISLLPQLLRPLHQWESTNPALIEEFKIVHNSELRERHPSLRDSCCIKRRDRLFHLQFTKTINPIYRDNSGGYPNAI